MDLEAVVAARPGAERAAEEGGALAHADEAVPAGAGDARAQRRVAAVGDAELERVRPVPERGSGVGSAGVLDDVGQGLLDDAVGRQVDALRQRTRLALHGELGPQPGRARPLQEAVEVAQPRLRAAPG